MSAGGDDAAGSAADALELLARARDAVRRLADVDGQPDGADPREVPADLLTSEGRALAWGWALKAACYETWNTDPAQAGVAARLLAELARQVDRPPLRALADWTAGIAALGAGDMAEALDRLDRAAAGFEAAGDPAHAAQTQVPKLMALSMLGRHDEALACGCATRERFLATGDLRSAGKIDLNLGTLLFRQDRHVEAVASYRAAATRFAQVQDSEQAIGADIGLANALSWLGRFDEARQILQQAGDCAGQAGLPVLAAQAHGSRGQLELLRDRPDLALPALVEACQLFERIGGLPQRRVEAELALADAYLAVRLLPEAVSLVRRAIDHAADLPAERARALLLLGQARAALGETDSARADLEAAALLFETQSNPASAALARLHRAALDLQAGEHLTALHTALSAGRTFETAGVPSWQAEASLLAAQARLAVASRSRADASNDVEPETQARLDLERLTRTPHLAAAWRARVGLADLDRLAGRNEDAARHLDLALTAIEAQRAALPGDDLRTAFGHDKAAVHDRRVELAWQAGRTGQPGHVDRLWLVLDEARARALAVARQRVEADIASDGDGRARLAWLREQSAQAMAQGDAAAAASHERAAREIEADLLETHRRARLQAFAQGAADTSALAAPTRADIQADLAPDEAWVQYHLLDDRWLALVLTRDQASTFEGPLGDGLDRLAALRFQIDAQRGRRDTPPAHAVQMAERTRRHLQALHARFWAPLAEALAGRPQIRLLPHRWLHYLPFAALHDGRRWLAEDYAIRLVPSARLCLSRRNDLDPLPWRGMSLVFGAGSDDLPQVEAEAQVVAARIGAASRLLLGAQATREALCRLAPDAVHLHLACHARFRADSPGYSALHLADGDLTLDDASRLQLRAELVTLSACETGLSRIAPGDEQVGLVRGFLLAGAQRVLASLWTVDDDSTARLMDALHVGLAEGLSVETALRRAQLALIASGQHPFHWAAFVLHTRR